ncbi:MAG: 4'-phosphopantetheinyl transferase superfamily protein [Oscillospiraceae bacterium]|nr:4'-phosphopantetheinyl transferase superfamily protein [Oscillospiraceae bacterium]
MVLAGEALSGRSGHEAGRQLLETLYRQQTGLPLPEIAITPRGKPYFINNPWQFSISHSKHHVFCALSRQPIGIDAEEQDREISLALAQKILSPTEYARYAEAPDKRQALLRLWVLKEAAAKATGEGLTGYPNRTDFSPDDPRIQILHGCFVAVVELTTDG